MFVIVIKVYRKQCCIVMIYLNKNFLKWSEVYWNIWATFCRRGSRQVEWSQHTHTEIFIFAAINWATDVLIIRFVFPLAFQCHIQNCSTAKTSEDIAKRKQKVESNGSTFLYFLDSYKHILQFSRATNVRFLNVFISLDLSFH